MKEMIPSRPFHLSLLAALTWGGGLAVPSLAAQSACTPSELVVCTEGGAVQGTFEAGARAFRGIPYTAPPIGELRFRPPQPAQPWPGVLRADRVGPVCPQLQANVVIGSEDCLTVNVWTPATRSAEPLPVMIFLTGGGNQGSSGSNYDGAMMASRENLVFVTYNLRLGVLGFLAHPALGRERPEGISGNYGSLDQIAMLRWVRSNIAQFGGDPDRVFLFGTSAGGLNICALLASPMTRGLFHGVSMQSSVPTGCELQTMKDLEERTGEAVARETGCVGAADVAACFRGLTVEQIVSAVPGAVNIYPRWYGPNVDGHVFPEQPIEAIRSGRHSRMPVLIGTTLDETRTFLNAVDPIDDAARFTQVVGDLFGGENRDAIVQRYPITGYESPRLALEAVANDAYFNCPTRRIARALVDNQGEPVFRYLFTHTLQTNEVTRARGSSHTLEHRFLFAMAEEESTDDELALHDLMVGYWSRMARTGDPNGEGAPHWPRYDANADPYMELSTNPGARANLSGGLCDFWDTVQLPWPRL